MTPGRIAGGDGPRRGWVVALVTVAAVGVSLRMIQIFAGAPMWVDEIHLVRNVLELPLVDLVRGPLRYAQVAPPVFLALVHGAVEVLGPSDAALRLVPALASLAAVAAVGILAARLLPGPAAVVALALFCLAPMPIHLGAVVKQYSSDVLASASMILLLLPVVEGRDDRPRLRATLAGLLGTLSTTAVLVGGAAAAGLAWRIVADPAGRRRSAQVLAILVVTSALVGALALASASPGTRAYMSTFWGPAFMPSVVDYPTWAVDRILDGVLPLLLYGAYPDADLLGVGPDWVVGTGILVFAGLGAWAMGRRRPMAAVLLAGPLVVALVASRAGVYPLAPRTSAYLLPSLVLLVGAGAGTVASRCRGRTARLLVLGAPLAVSMVALVRSPPPWRVLDLRPLLEELATRRAPGDRVLVTGSPLPVERYGARAGVGPLEVVPCDGPVPAVGDAPRVWVLRGRSICGEREAEALRSLSPSHRETWRDQRGGGGFPSVSLHLFTRVGSAPP